MVLPKTAYDSCKPWKPEMIDIQTDHFATVKQILAEYFPDCEVRAFGSRVTQTAKSYSDLDLAIVGQNALDNDRFRHLKEAFEESNLPFRVDVLDWHRISDSFHTVIEKQYQVIQKAMPSTIKKD